MIHQSPRSAPPGHELSEAVLLELLRLRDPGGVLSVYVDSGAGEGLRHAPPPGEISVRRQIGELLDSVRRDGPRERWSALKARLAALADDLDELLDPARPGRGRALFSPMAGGTRTLTCWHELPNQVVLGPTAYVRPLLTVLDAGRPAGLVVASARAVRLIDLRFGRAADVLHRAVPDESADWRRLQGPAASNPAQSQHSSSQRDLFLRRLAEHRQRFYAEVARDVSRAARRRRWTRLVLSGEPHLVQALREALPEQGPPIVSSAVMPAETLSATAVANLLAEDLRRVRLDEQEALAARARDLALAPGGLASLGLDETLAALGEGRVRELLLDSRQEIVGQRAADGRLVPPGEVPPGTRRDGLRPEPHLVERMIERAFETGGRITPIEGRAAELLRPWGGVGALLRW